MDVSVVIPAYREASNLVVLIPQIAEVLAAAGLHGEIIVVDDDSRDGTMAVCAELSRTAPLRLITRTDERGLATAVVCGLRAARGDVLLVMDADLSRPPEAIPALAVECRKPSVDFVIGSRYASGGSVDQTWSKFRRWNSTIATLLARGLTDASDPMAGFFAIRRATLARGAELRPLGYKIGLELIVRCGCQAVREIPIAFQDRLHGESKLSLAQQWLYVRHLGRLYGVKYPTLASFVRFALVGLSGMAVDLGTLVAALPLAPLAVARVAAIMTAMTWNFVLHRRISFAAAGSGPLIDQYARFCGACAVVRDAQRCHVARALRRNGGVQRAADAGRRDWRHCGSGGEFHVVSPVGVLEGRDSHGVRAAERRRKSRRTPRCLELPDS